MHFTWALAFRSTIYFYIDKFSCILFSKSYIYIDKVLKMRTYNTICHVTVFFIINVVRGSRVEILWWGACLCPLEPERTRWAKMDFILKQLDCSLRPCLTCFSSPFALAFPFHQSYALPVINSSLLPLLSPPRVAVACFGFIRQAGIH